MTTSGRFSINFRFQLKVSPFQQTSAIFQGISTYDFKSHVDWHMLIWYHLRSSEVKGQKFDFMIFIKYMIILIPGGAETPLRLSVPPINTKFISSPEHWNTSTYLNIRFKYMGLMNHHWWLIINEYPMYFSLTVCKPAILFQATSDNQATDWSAPAPTHWPMAKNDPSQLVKNDPNDF